MKNMDKEVKLAFGTILLLLYGGALLSGMNPLRLVVGTIFVLILNVVIIVALVALSLFYGWLFRVVTRQRLQDSEVKPENL